MLQLVDQMHFFEHQAQNTIKETEILQNIGLLWLDANVHNQESQLYYPVLKRIFENRHFFTSIESYQEFVDQLKDKDQKKFFVILSGSLGVKFMKEYSSSKMILSVFIFCGNVPFHKNWSQHYDKVKAVVNHFSKIKDHILLHIRTYRHEDKVFKQAFKFNSIEACQEFVINDFIFQLVAQFQESSEKKEQDIKDFYRFARIYISENQENQHEKDKHCGFLSELMSELENETETGESIIKKFFGFSFLYEMINYTIRQQCLSDIYQIRYIIYLLYHQVKNYKQNISQYPKQLYRGVCLPIDDFNMWKESSYILFLRGFSTLTQDLKKAKNFAKIMFDGFSSDQDKYCKVLIEIETNLTENPPIAIKNFSSLGQNEYLVQHNTFLSIGNVMKQKDFWVIKAKQCSFDEIPEAKSIEILELQKKTNQILCEKINVQKFSMAKLLWSLDNKYQDFSKLMEGWEADGDLDESFRRYYLSNCKNELGLYREALCYQKLSLDLKIKTVGKNHIIIGNSYNSYGFIYQNIGNYPEALEYYEKSLGIYQNILGENHIQVAKNMNNIGLVYVEMNNYPKAIEYYQKSLQIYQSSLGEDHPSTATSYNNIGLVYFHMGNHEKALEFYYKSEKIYHKTLGEFHSSVATIYYNIGQVLIQLKKYKEAQQFHDKSLKLKLKILGEGHLSIAHSYNSLGLVFQNLDNPETAHDFFGKSLIIYKQLFEQEDHIEKATIYNNIGLLYVKQNQSSGFTQGLQYLQKAYEIKKKIIGQDNYFLTNSLNSISLVYFKVGHYQKALEYQNLSLKIYLKIRGKFHHETANSYLNIARIHCTNGNYSQALLNYQNYQNILNQLYGPNCSDFKNITKVIEIMRQKLN